MVMSKIHNEKNEKRERNNRRNKIGKINIFVDRILAQAT